MKKLLTLLPFFGLLSLIVACSGINSTDPLGGGLGKGGSGAQPTVPAGADHQGPTPIEDGDAIGDFKITPPGEPPPDPDDFDGADDLSI